jgi:N-acetylglucosamine-6-sulfatase
MRRAAPICVAVLLGLMAALPAAAVAAKPSKPNVVMVITDDQTLAQYDERTMPKTQRLLGRAGTTFTEAIVTTPLCCPSRATMLTGQYGHNNGVLRNNYDDLRAKDNTLPVWLEEAGYATIHVGKYMNQYAEAVEPDTEVAPGWDEWHSVITPRYFNYELMVNGRAEPFGAAPEDYLGRVLTERSTAMVEDYAPKRRPFYLQLDHFAPHIDAGTDPGRCAEAAVPDPLDYDRFAGDPLPTSASFDEEDVSDKPSFIQALPRIDGATRAGLADRHACALASLRSVDRSIAAVHRAVKRAGELRETVFVFVSDNGFFAGEHRIPTSKQNAYEETLRVPLVISAPKGLLDRRPPRQLGLPVANVDLAPTILDFARAEPCRTNRDCRRLDGRSLVPLLEGRRGAWPRDRAIVVELDRGKSPVEADGRACAYTGARTRDAMYVEHSGAIDPSTGDCLPLAGGVEYELYDLAEDPFELESLAPAGAAPGTGVGLFEDMAERSEKLRDCAGIRGRDPRPGGGRTWCE